MIFIEMPELKAKLAKVFPVEQGNKIFIDLIPSPKTQKKFGAIIERNADYDPKSGIPATFTKQHDVLKVEQVIDSALPTKFMYENEAVLLEGCIVNVDPSKQVAPIHVW